jgi:hypothetical protein
MPYCASLRKSFCRLEFFAAVHVGTGMDWWHHEEYGLNSWRLGFSPILICGLFHCGTRAAVLRLVFVCRLDGASIFRICGKTMALPLHSLNLAFKFACCICCGIAHLGILCASTLIRFGPVVTVLGPNCL